MIINDKIRIGDTAVLSGCIRINQNLLTDMEKHEVLGKYYDNLIGIGTITFFLDDQEWVIDETWKQSPGK